MSRIGGRRGRLRRRRGSARDPCSHRTKSMPPPRHSQRRGAAAHCTLARGDLLVRRPPAPELALSLSLSSLPPPFPSSLAATTAKAITPLPPPTPPPFSRSLPTSFRFSLSRLLTTQPTLARLFSLSLSPTTLSPRGTRLTTRFPIPKIGCAWRVSSPPPAPIHCHRGCLMYVCREEGRH